MQRKRSLLPYLTMLGRGHDGLERHAALLLSVEDDWRIARPPTSIQSMSVAEWLYPVFGHAGASYFLGASEWTFGSLLLAGFWDKRLGVLGALGSTGTFIATVTIIPFMPEAWDVAARFALQYC
jgi:uncharacterized protein DUF417